MNRRTLKNFLTKPGTVWTLSLCMTGIIVLGGIATVNNTREKKSAEVQTELGQLAYLEEELSDDAEENLLPTLGEDANEQAADAGEGQNTADVSADGAGVSADTGTDEETDNTGYYEDEMTDASSGAVTGGESGDADTDSTAADTDNESLTDGETADDAQTVSGDGAADEGAEMTDSEEVSAENIISEQTLLDAGVSFTGDESLLWPSAGTILIDYSMDGSVYFPTLNQYRYNPALIIGSDTGNQVLAAAKGIVESISVTEETGTTLVLNLGNGYKLTYGQLKEIAASEGDVVDQGQLLGYVSEPTKYYSKEGSNLYFAMTQDGTAVDPVLYLE